MNSIRSAGNRVAWSVSRLTKFKLGCPVTQRNLTFYNLSRMSSVDLLRSKKMVTYSEIKRFRQIIPKLKLEEIEARVMDVCARHEKIGKNNEKLHMDSNFIDDLGLDSLDHVEVIMDIESNFGFEIGDEVAEKLFTPKDIIKLIHELELKCDLYE